MKKNFTQFHSDAFFAMTAIRVKKQRIAIINIFVSILPQQAERYLRYNSHNEKNSS